MKVPRLLKKLAVLIHLLLWLAVILFFIVVPDPPHDAAFKAMLALLVVFGASAVPAALVCLFSFCRAVRARDISLILQSSVVGIVAGIVIAYDIFGVYLIYLIAISPR